MSKRCDYILLSALNIRGGSRISEGGVGGRLFKGVWVRKADFISVSLNILLLHYLYEIKFKNLLNMSFLVYTPFWYHNAPH